MGFPLVAAGVGTLGATAGAAAENALGGLVGGDGSTSGSSGQDIQNYTNNLIKQMNKMISSGQNNALAYSEGNLRQALGAQGQYLSGAVGNLQNYLGQANTAATGAVNKGLAQYQALQSPYAMSGYNAMDAYNDSLGLSRPQMGGGAIASALSGAQKAKELSQGIFGSANMPQSLPTAPTAPGPYQAPTIAPFSGQAPTMAQAQAAVANPAVAEQLLRTNKYFQNNYLKPGQSMSGLAAPYALADMQRQYNASVQAYQQANQQAQQQAQAAYQAQQNQYNTQMGQYQSQIGKMSDYFGQLQSSGYTPQQAALAAAYNKGLFTR